MQKSGVFSGDYGDVYWENASIDERESSVAVGAATVKQVGIRSPKARIILAGL